MDPALENIGWTEEQWNRICTTVTEEAQKARVAAQFLPISGPEDANTIAIPRYTLSDEDNQAYTRPPERRLIVDSNPTLYLTTIAINVHLRTHETAAPDLTAALVMFRRAANHIARIEDALVFNGRPGKDKPPPTGLKGIPEVYRVTGDEHVAGIFWPGPRADDDPDRRTYLAVDSPPAGNSYSSRGQPIVNAVVSAIEKLEGDGQLGPFACVLGHDLFHDVCDPTSSLVLPRDRILPFLDGPLLRSSAIETNWGAVIALSGSPVEIVVASDVCVRFLQTTLEPRSVFRVSERVALRIKEEKAIVVLRREAKR